MEEINYKPIIKGELNAEFCVIGGGNTIGGSCYLLKFNGVNILLDAGVSFGERDELIPPRFEVLRNFGLKGIEEVDLFILTHAHLDHSGAIVDLYKKAPKVPMFATEATCELVNKLIGSSIKRQQDYRTERFYLEKCLSSVNKVEFRKSFTLNVKGQQLKIEFFRAGHILGAAAVYLEMEGKGIFFTGDYCVQNQKTALGMDVPKGYNIELVITESTYGSNISNVDSTRVLQEQDFMKCLINNIKEDKKVLIPAFALGRAQEVIQLMLEYFEKESKLPFRLYIDGAVVDMCEIYSKYTGLNFKGKGIFYANDNQGYSSKEEFIENEVIHHKCCVVASSGMLKDDSSSACYAEKFIEDESAVCILTGYQDEDSTGCRLKGLKNKREEKQYIDINGRLLTVKCGIEEYYLSAHSNLEEIVSLVFVIHPSKVCLIHGAVRQGEESLLYKRLSRIKDLQVVQSFNGNKYKF